MPEQPQDHIRIRPLGIVAIALATGVLLALGFLLAVMTMQRSGEVTDGARDTNIVDGDATTRTDWPVFLTSMTHLESNWTDAADDEDFYQLKASLVRHGMDVAEEYGALLTIESEIPMAEGMEYFDDNILSEALARGHGVGTHCDISPREAFTQAEMIDEFRARKEIVDRLVGASENLGCSGGGGLGDWYAGAVGAGFRYLDGIVGFHYLALPEALRPRGWNNTAIVREYFHLPAPQDWDLYFHPYLVSGLGFTEDPDGDLLISAGTLDNVENLAEGGATWTMTNQGSCREDCPFTADDVAVAVDFLTTFLAANDGTRPAKITFYLPTSAFEAEDTAALSAFFAAMQTFVDEGSVQWASQREVYDVMMEYYGR